MLELEIGYYDAARASVRALGHSTVADTYTVALMGGEPYEHWL